ncbi:hypothetical protein [Agrococcus jejuensis]|uniref:Uncharacterized protein n=1 Tax=Agrococcus jejuensis TaxID=399736 RepID=A0A1G8D1D1_9MICO|nr:hypothetical protein [Agrococcus jejuensis]SDH51482.1 hypothetical protein SAMN04489720_1481 [Agrococcus jejuensis]
MNPGPGFGGGPGIDGTAIAQSIVTLLVLGGVVLFGVLVLRRLGAIERAVRGEPARIAAPVAPPVVQAPATPVAQPTDGDQRAWQQQAPVTQTDDAATRPPAQQQLREGPAPA